MGLETSDLQADLAYIFDDLDDADFVETAETSDGDTFSIIRGKNLSSEELSATGWGQEYQFSVYLERTDVSLSIGDDITVSEGTLRILNIVDMPGRVWRRLDLGGQYGGQ